MKKKPNFTSFGKELRQRGFALVATLTLLSLMSLIAIGLLNLSAVESRRKGLGSHQDIARANAKMALLLALSELQQHLGPDQRINANASILNAEDDSPSTTDRWIGVWDSWAADEVAGPNDNLRPTPVFRRWLVSGPENVVTNSTLEEGPGIDQSIVFGRQRVEDGGELRETRARLVDIETEQTNGKYAWWVEDEASKARIDVSPSFEDQKIASYLQAAQGGVGANHQMLSEMAGVPRDEPRLDQIVSPRTLEFLSQGPIQRDSNLDDFLTTLSMGVQSDTRRGGLKRDLSLKLADTSLAGLDGNDLDQDENILYSVRGRGGINFKELHTYFTLPGELSSPVASQGARPFASSYPVLQASRTRGGLREATTDEHLPYRRPAILSAGYMIGAKRVVSNGVNRLAFTQDFLLTLWNPYDTNLAIGRPTHLTLRMVGLPVEFDIDNGQGLVTRRFSDAALGGLSFNFGARTPVVMQPGEVLIGSSASNTQRLVSAGQPLQNVPGGLGWNNNAGFTIGTNVDLPDSGNIEIALRPVRGTGNGGAQFSIMQFLRVMGNDLAPRNGSLWRGGLLVDRGRTLNAINREGFELPEFRDFIRQSFPEIRKSISVASLNSSDLKVPIAYVGLVARTEAEDSVVGRHMSRLNPAGTAYDFQDFSSNTIQGMPFSLVAEEITSLTDLPFDVNGANGFYGSSVKSSVGSSNVITHSIPRAPIFSIAALQHANANGSKHLHFGRWGEERSSDFHDRILNPPISHAIGNSFAVPMIESDQTEGSFNSFPAADHSYLANRELWDSWFFSSLGPQTPNDWNGVTEERTAEIVFDEFAGREGTTIPLPNNKFVYFGSDPESDRDELFANGQGGQKEPYEKTAAFLMNKGSFNVNSTDPRAWEALLSSLAKHDVRVLSLGGGEEWEQGEVPVLGKPITAGNQIVTSDIDDQGDANQWIGFRDLTPEEITELSEELVKEIQARGPFLNLGDFINRRLDGESEWQLMGPLQAALDRTVNRPLVQSSDRSTSAKLPPIESGMGVAFPEADEGAISTASGAYVKQADILTTIGPSLSARSDTFVIRAYGDHRATPGGPVLATAYCEAVVQRFPEYVNSESNEPYADFDDLSETNQTFGRRFRMISFRYLSDDEI